MKTKIRSLGEIALRVNDLKAMSVFYEETVGLEPIRKSDDMTFFKIAEGYGGHTTVLALFDRTENPGYAGLDVEKTTIDHFAFTIDKSDFEEEKERLLGMGINLQYSFHDWVQWRSLYFSDPEGNRVEFVCYDPSSKH